MSATWQDMDEVEWVEQSSDFRMGDYPNVEEIDGDSESYDWYLHDGNQPIEDDFQCPEGAGIDLILVSAWRWPNDCDHLGLYMRLMRDAYGWGLTHSQCIQVLVFATSSTEDKRQMLIQLELST